MNRQDHRVAWEQEDEAASQQPGAEGEASNPSGTSSGDEASEDSLDSSDSEVSV